jgi:hypothetical protein
VVRFLSHSSRHATHASAIFSIQRRLGLGPHWRGVLDTPAGSRRALHVADADRLHLGYPQVSPVPSARSTADRRLQYALPSRSCRRRTWYAACWQAASAHASCSPAAGARYSPSTTTSSGALRCASSGELRARARLVALTIDTGTPSSSVAPPAPPARRRRADARRAVVCNVLQIAGDFTENKDGSIDNLTVYALWVSTTPVLCRRHAHAHAGH